MSKKAKLNSDFMIINFFITNLGMRIHASYLCFGGSVTLIIVGGIFTEYGRELPAAAALPEMLEYALGVFLVGPCCV